MKSEAVCALRELESPTAPVALPAVAVPLERIKSYYRAVVQDFPAWSPQVNMHFGYWNWPANPLVREPMLERMNVQVIRALQLPASGAVRLADLGCGAAATARSAVRNRGYTTVDAVTLVPEQIEQAAALNASAGLHGAVRLHLADYVATDLPSAAYDGVYALESACHARGPDKAALVAEMHRLLKPGARLVIVDALLRDERPLPGWLNVLYRRFCSNWAIGELAQLPALQAELMKQDFCDVQVRDISARVAPSALHIPVFATVFALRELWRAWCAPGGRPVLSAWRKAHIEASFLAFALGCCLGRFGYFVVTATRAAPELGADPAARPSKGN